MSERQARIGVIGTGWWATYAHLPSLTTYPDAEVIGVADINLDKARRTADRFGVPAAFGDHRELLARRPDGVVIATPHDTHYALARDALLAGADVMIEKPMVVEAEHGRELVALAKRLGRTIHVGYPYPFGRHARLLRDLIAAGDLGELHFCTALMATTVLDFYQGDTARATDREGTAMWNPGSDTYSAPERGGGQLLTQVTHEASLLFFLTGLRPTQVHAFTGSLDTRVDVWDAVNFRTESGASGSVASVGTVPPTQPPIEEYRIFGDRGHALLDTVNGTLSIRFNDGATRDDTLQEGEERYLLHQTSRQLVDTILDRSPALTGGDLGLLTVEFLAAALESSRTGQVVSLPPDQT